MADEVGEQRARLDLAFMGAPVDLHGDPHAAALSRATRASSRRRARRQSASAPVSEMLAKARSGSSSTEPSSRHLDLHEQLVGLERGRQEPDEELVGAQDARPARRAHMEESV